MNFASISFLFFFFPIVIIIYYGCSFHKGIQNLWLLFASLAFYGWSEPSILILLGSLIIQWGLGIWTGKSRNRIPLILGCFYTISILCLFKYIVPLSKEGSLILPLGLSFITFRFLAYLCDIYHKKIEPENNFIYFSLYIIFFPKVFLGPLMDYRDFREQLMNREHSLRKCGVGCSRFIIGLGKKVILSANLAVLSDVIFNYSAMGKEQVLVPAFLGWLGLLAFLLQLYFDLSGYMDMAIGLGLLFGFRLDESFDYPYSASSVQDFWKRWNITLLRWFQTYVYGSLQGKSIQSKDKMVQNLFITWVILGLWHGITGKYILWAVWNFFFILMEHFLGYPREGSVKWLARLYTLLVVSFGMVLLRAQDMYQAGQFLLNLLGLNYNGLWNFLTAFLLKEYGVFILLGILFSFPLARKVNHYLVEGKKTVLTVIWTYGYPIVLMVVFFVSLSYMVRNPVSWYWYLRY